MFLPPDFGTLFTSDLFQAVLIWLLLAPVLCLSLLISQHGTIATLPLSKWPLSLLFFPPLHLSHWWELDATPPAVPVSTLIDVWYSEVVISRRRTRGCLSMWLLKREGERGGGVTQSDGSVMCFGLQTLLSCPSVSLALHLFPLFRGLRFHLATLSISQCCPPKPFTYKLTGFPGRPMV